MRTKGRTTHRIAIYLNDLSQLFNSMDPSPFHEKDLDDDAEEFVVRWAQEYPVRDPIILAISLSEYPSNSDPQRLVAKAVHNHFAYTARLNRLKFKRLLSEGRVSLGFGLLFLLTCLATSQLLPRSEANTLTGVLRESLTIGGWVAMWRPMEMFLYEWWPLLRPGRTYEKMSHMPVEVRRRTPG